MKKTENYSSLILVGLALSLVVLIGFSFSLFGENARVARASEELAAERIQKGVKIYQAQCVSCHGVKGEGGIGPALNNSIVLKNTLDDVFFSIIRSGVPNTQMPAWSVDYGGPLTDEDIRDVVAMMRSWEATAPEVLPPSNEPDPLLGAVIFDSACTACHGPLGKGIDGAGALDLAGKDEAWLTSMIAVGLPAKGMPGYAGALTEKQISDVVALFLAWQAGQSVQPSYSVTDMLAAAVFTLQNEDSESALMYLERALAAAPQGLALEIMTGAKAQIESGEAAAALTALADLAQQWPIGDPVTGEQQYQTSCKACHGAQGEGGVGKALKPNQYIQDNTNAELVKFLLQGRPGTAMAGFDGRLSEQQLADIVAFLRTWQP